MKKLCFVLLLAASAFGVAGQNFKLQQRWALAPGERTYLGTSTTERGLAYNPATGHLLLVTRSADYHIYILDATTAAELGELSKEGIAQPGQGTFLLSKVAVADDGTIYAANFGSIGSATPTFNIYRWENESAVPTIAYAADPGAGNIQQWGTTFDVRGSGPNTQILAGSTGGGIAALFTTTDGANFTSQVIATDANSDVFSIGAAFGEGNTIWAKSVENALTLLKFDTTLNTATTVRRWSATNFPITIGPIGVQSTNKLLAAINVTTPDYVNLYNISDTNSAPKLIDSVELPTNNNNNLYMGAVDFGPNALFALDSNNGIVAYDLVANTGPVVASIVSNPIRTQTVRVGRPANFIVHATGTEPLTYYWYFKPTLDSEPELITAATTATNRINSVQLSDAGFYSVVVSNAAGTARSLQSELVVDPSQAPEALVQAWTLPSGSRPYLTGSNNQRGLAYNPVTKHLLLVNRAGSLSIRILDAATGADLGAMDTTGISVGTFVLNKIEVTDDGVIYASNFGSISSTVTFKIYRWANESAAPTVAFDGNPAPGTNLQYGNDMNLRGTGTNTQIVVPSQRTVVAIFTTDDGTNFVSHPIATDNGEFTMHRGVAFGGGNTFWATAENNPLYRVAFDLETDIGAIDQIWETSELPYTVTPIAVDVKNKLLAGLSVATPDTVSLYDIANVETQGPVLLQSVPFPTDVANTLFAGALDFGGNRLFVLDTNNGITAYDLPLLPVEETPELNISRNGDQITISWSATGFRLQTTSDLNTNNWTDVPNSVGQTSVTVMNARSMAFYRLVK